MICVRTPYICIHALAHSMCHCVVIKSIELTFTVSSSEVIFASTAVAICFILTNPAVLAWCRYTRVVIYTNQINVKFSAYKQLSKHSCVVHLMVICPHMQAIFLYLTINIMYV